MDCENGLSGEGQISSDVDDQIQNRSIGESYHTELHLGRALLHINRKDIEQATVTVEAWK